MTNEEYQHLRNQLLTMRSQTTESEFGVVSKSVKHLLQLLDRTQNKEDRRLLFLELTGECLHSNNDSAYLHVLRKECLEFPDYSIGHASLALALAARSSDDPSAGRQAINSGTKALRLAIEQKRMVKYCGSNLARVALIVDDYVALHLAVSELLADAGNRHAEDHKYEFDFVNRIDPKRFDNELLSNYIALGRAR